MRILLTGCHGQLGHALSQRLHVLSDDVVSIDSDQLDLSDADAIRTTMQSIQPDLVINPAAYTAVDQAEDERELAEAINATAPAVMADMLRQQGARLVHFSTDYVFDGTAQQPYRESDRPNPQSVYGYTKLQGELAIRDSGVSHLVFRTSWLYGLYGRNFYLTMRRLLSEREQVSVVDDQFGAPTWADDLADAVIGILQQSAGQADWWQQYGGIYHLTNAGQTSWYGFACAIADQLREQQQRVADVQPVPSSAYPTRAARPAYSVLDNQHSHQVFGLQLPEWTHFFTAVQAG